MRKLLILPAALMMTFVFASSAWAQNFVMNIEQYGNYPHLNPYKVQVTMPGGWAFNKWDTNRVGLSFYKKLTSRCGVVLSVYSSDSRDYESKTSNAQYYVDSQLSIGKSYGSIGSGGMNNGKTSAGGFAWNPNGRWGALTRKDTQGKAAYEGSAGFSMSKKSGSYYRQAGVTGQLTANFFGSCSSAQVTSQRIAISQVLSSARIV